MAAGGTVTGGKPWFRAWGAGLWFIWWPVHWKGLALIAASLTIIAAAAIFLAPINPLFATVVFVVVGNASVIVGWRHCERWKRERPEHTFPDARRDN
jgi:membrane protein implicated in regulation of membrane protease activity